MNFTGRRYLALATAGALFIALGALAFMQYRWIGEAGRAEVERTKASIRRSADQMAAEFNTELNRLYMTVLARGSAGDGDHRAYSDGLTQWMATTDHPRIVRGLFLSEGGPDGLDVLFRFNPQAGRFDREVWPKELEPLVGGLRERLHNGGLRPRLGPPGFAEDLPVIVLPRTLPGRREDRPPRPEGPGFGAEQLLPEDEDPRRGPEWRPRDGPPPGDEGAPPPRQPRGVPRRHAGWAVIWLSLEEFQSNWAPEMYRRYFAGDDAVYDVRIVSKVSGRPVFDSNASAPKNAFDHPDAEVPMFDIRPATVAGGPGGMGLGPPGARPGAGNRPGAVRWTILVRDRSGSVESAVARANWRNVAVSGAAFLIMAAAAAALLISIRNSERLARQQMQFVAAVSHELRTPLAVIRSAAENLADGVVHGDESMRQYGTVIRDEGRRLSFMVEQTLRFAGIQTGRARYNLAPVSIAAVVDEALKSCDAALNASGCTVERTVEESLPPVLADAGSLSLCVANLLTNAAKHAKDGGWIGVRAESGGNARIRIEVSDRGPGIDHRDLPHIFEPFYRGRRSESQQISGTGLGLALVRQIVTAHHGEVTVETKNGAGSRFVLSLPAAEVKA